MVSLNSGSSEHFCPDCEPKFCPICGSKLVPIKYRGKKSDLLASATSKGFRYFLGCVRIDLHDKVLDGVDYRGKVYVLGAIFDDAVRGR